MHLKENSLILDTHIWYWLLTEHKKIAGKRGFLEKKAQEGKLYISAISIWELSLLERKGRLVLTKSCDAWIKEALIKSGTNVIPINEKIAIESNILPEPFHDDPADRFIVATSRVMNIPLFTHDTQILNYAKKGHLNLAH